MSSKRFLLAFLVSLVFINSCNTPTATPSQEVLPTTTSTSFPTNTQIPISPTPMSGCATANVRVRSEPNTSSTILGGLPTGTCVSVIKTNSEKTWLWISSDNISGWVSSDYISFGGQQKDILPVDESESSPILSPTFAMPPTSTSLPPPTTTPRKTSTPISTATKSILLCSNTRMYAGSYVTCMIPTAYCDYRPDVNGSPTFCDDRPYPNNNFQLVAWGTDWSVYDGKCIVVTGTVSIYSGKAQIEGYSRSQVSYCQ